MRSSARSRRVDASDETTRRARATNSGRAGISSSMAESTTRPSLSLLGDCGVDRVVDREHLGEAGDLEHLEDAVLRAHEAEVTVVAADPLQPADEHAEAGRVEELD